MSLSPQPCPQGIFSGDEVAYVLSKKDEKLGNLKIFTDIKLSRKALKIAKPRKFLSAKAFSLKVYAQNEAAYKQSNRLRVVFNLYLLLIATITYHASKT